MTWQAAMAEAQRNAREHAGYRFRVQSYRHWREWRYEVRCAGPVVTR